MIPVGIIIAVGIFVEAIAALTVKLFKEPMADRFVCNLALLLINSSMVLVLGKEKLSSIDNWSMGWFTTNLTNRIEYKKCFTLPPALKIEIFWAYLKKKVLQKLWK